MTAALDPSKAPFELPANADPAVKAWENTAKRSATPTVDRHSIHSYYLACPESPDGKYVLYYTSGARDGEHGDLRIVERATGKEIILVTGIVAEDAHRAACQHWVANGKKVVYHNYRDGRWFVLSVDIATLEQTVLAEDRQIGYGSPAHSWVPVYGCHWNPGPHRDLELVHVETGESKILLSAGKLKAKYTEWADRVLGSGDVSVFFPVLSPDGKKVFFKLSKGNGGNEFRSSQASIREGKFVFDIIRGEIVTMMEHWGHPSWAPDSQGIFEAGNSLTRLSDGKVTQYAPSCPSDHPSISPAGGVFVTDGHVWRNPWGKRGDWAIVVGSLKNDEYLVVDLFCGVLGAETWRKNHPHPTFSTDGRRVYYNVNDGPWTRLMVAERHDPAVVV